MKSPAAVENPGVSLRKAAANSVMPLCDSIDYGRAWRDSHLNAVAYQSSHSLMKSAMVSISVSSRNSVGRIRQRFWFSAEKEDAVAVVSEHANAANGAI